MTKNSVHLQNFPDVSFLKSEESLIKNMDLVRQVCSTALFIRDQNNLRVRLPLNKLTIIGANAPQIAEFKSIISDEVNVKNIEIISEIGDLAEIKLQLNFKKVGAKLGSKMKELTAATRNNQWEKISENEIKIAGETLINDEFEIKLITKNPKNTAALPSNDCLIELDLEITKELKEEGSARDIIRAIQQNRKDANFNVSDRIKIAISSQNNEILEAVKNFNSYICEQTLADEILISQNQSQNYQFNFENKIEDGELKISLSVSIK
ncbi:MAG: isoleucyl-tRNA synthetase [Lentimonas sp.]|jgi:isoleucyl-tRNA synthetase